MRSSIRSETQLNVLILCWRREQRWHGIGALQKGALFVVHEYDEENLTAKKLSASSRSGKHIRVGAESYPEQTA